MINSVLATFAYLTVSITPYENCLIEFGYADSDADGLVSTTEFVGGQSSFSQEEYGEVDVDVDGFITQSEWAAACSAKFLTGR